MNREKTPAVSDRSGEVSPAKADRLIDSVARESPQPQQFVELIKIIGSLTDLPVYTDNRIELLIDGPATYTAMERAIQSARHFIHLETYIFANDKVGQRFSSALMAKAEEGVSVRVIFDSLGSLTSGDDFFEQMRGAGIEVLEFNDLNPLDGGNPLDANTRDHRKLLIVDGDVAFTGGVNFSKSHSSRPGQNSPDYRMEDSWRDTHVAVFGPAVAGLEQIFEENWRDGGKDLDGSVISPKRSGVTGHDTIAVLSAKGGDDIESSIYHAYLHAIQAASESVWITQAYFAPDDKLIAALSAAARREIDVRIVVPGQSDSRLVLNISRSRYLELLRAGVVVYETESTMLHAKTAVVDGVWSTIGSSNLDYRSTLHNDEVNIVIFGSSFGSKLEEQFQIDIDACRKITLEDWEQRSIAQKFFEFVSRPFAYWL